MKILSLKNLFIILTVGSAMVLMFYSCKKAKTQCDTVILVKAQWDTNIIIPFADVVVGGQFSDVAVSGKTDATGTFAASFKLEAILTAVASKDTTTLGHPSAPVLTGAAVVRLQPGQTVYKTVYIH